MTTALRYLAVLAILGAGCEQSPGTTACGDRTMLVGAECVPEIQPPPPDAPGSSCSSGTPDENGTCVVDTMRYEIRIAETTLGANGHTRRRVLVIGTKADGTPSLEPVVLGVDRASAGVLTETTLALGPLGAETTFTPCAEASPGCLGAAKLTVALASAPTVIVAAVDVMLVPPTMVSSIAPCTVGGNVLYVDGNRAIVDRIVTITEATWARATYPAVPNEVQLTVEPSNPLLGNRWTLQFDTIQLGTPLGVRTYQDAEPFHFATAGHPGMSISGNGQGCSNASNASYQVHAFDSMRVTISFEMLCDAVPEKYIEGCIHVGP